MPASAQNTKHIVTRGDVGIAHYGGCVRRENMPKFIQIHPGDTVAVALGKIEKGTVFQGGTALEDIPQGHKMALK